jgi:GNAT superfamily N-acetyltransferase
MLEVRVLDSAEVRTHVEDVRRIHHACFPEDVDDEDAAGAGGHPDDAFWDRLTACHDADDVLWFLLVDAGDPDARAEDPDAATRRRVEDASRPGTAREGAEDRIETINEKNSRVVGFAAATRYGVKCAYGMHLAVAPRYRGVGYGAWLMREVQSWACSEGYKQMQASVDAKNKRLIAYYESLGAERVAGLSGAGGSAGGSAPTVVRIARRFDEVLSARELRSSRERHRYMNELRRESEGEIKNRKRLLLSALKSFVASALCFAAAAIARRRTTGGSTGVRR